MGAFPAPQENGFSNPFNSTNNGTPSWGNANTWGGPPPFANPFRDSAKTNGFSQGYQPTGFPIVPTMNGTSWGANPFKVIFLRYGMSIFLVFIFLRLELLQMSTQTRFYEWGSVAAVGWCFYYAGLVFIPC